MEDLHWSDPSTLELLGMLIEQLSSASVLLLLTFRPEFEPPWSGRSRPLHLTLHPLTRKQTTVMIQQIVGGKPLPAVVLEQLVTKTDGVPLFIEELTKTVLESDLLRESDSVYERTDPLPELAVPATLQDSLMARLDRLGSAKEVAQLGAVLGREFPHELLAAVSPMDEPTLASAVEELAKADLLHRRGLPPRAVYTFKHALVQDTAYQSLLKGTRLEWHARVARALEERFPARVAAAPEVAARHYEEGGLAVQAIPLYLQAGEAATEQSANAEAIGHLRRGIALLEQLPEGIDRDRTELPLRVALGGPLVAAQSYSSPEVAQTYERARELCQNIGEAPELARALYGLATYYTARAQLEPALEVSQQLLGLGERSGEAAVLLVGHLIMGVSLYWRGEPSRSRKHLEQTIALYDPDQHSGLAYVYGQNPDQFSRSIVAWTDWLVGHPDAALHRAEESVERARKDGHPFSLAFALAYGAVVPQLRGEQSEARGWVEEVLSLSEEYAFPLPLGVAKVFHGRAIADPESGDRAIEEVHQGMATLAGARTEVGGPYVLCMLAETQQRAGRLDDALASVEGALAIGVATHQHFWDADLERLRGELLLQKDAGAVEEAESAFRRGLQVAREQKARSLELRLAVRLARLLAGRGRPEEARTLLAPIYDGFTEGFETQDLRDARALLE